MVLECLRSCYVGKGLSIYSRLPEARSASTEPSFANDGNYVDLTGSVARIRRLSIRELQLDDYLLVLASGWYTLLCVSLNKVANGGGSNLMTEEDIRN